MKAITICQPYASAIMSGIKRVENRDWPTNYRGPLLIHSGKSRQWLDSYDGAQMEEMEQAGFKFDEDGQLIITHPEYFGAIIGIVDLVGCTKLDKYLEYIGNQDAWAFGEYCWIIENPRWVKPVIPYRGQLGLFNVPDEVVKEAISNI